MVEIMGNSHVFPCHLVDLSHVCQKNLQLLGGDAVDEADLGEGDEVWCLRLRCRRAKNHFKRAKKHCGTCDMVMIRRDDFHSKSQTASKHPLREEVMGPFKKNYHPNIFKPQEVWLECLGKASFFGGGGC